MLRQELFSAVLTTPLETLPERTGDPEEGMEAEEGKGAHQQTTHGPEGIEQIGILLPIMVGGMGQVAGELPVRIRMTRLAGFHHIIAVQLRLGVIGRQNIMGTVAIRALGGFRPTGKQRYLAVIGVEIGLGFMFMTGTAFLQNHTPEGRFIDPLDGMRCVTVIAYRQFFVCFVDRGTVNGLLELLGNTEVTGGAGIDNICTINAGI